MDKTNGRVQILNGQLFFSPNCSRTVDYPPAARDENGCEHNIFLPSSNRHLNYFELDIAQYAIPRWWSLAFGWIAFFPLYPSFSGPIFEKLIMPAHHHHVSNDKQSQYLMPFGLSNKWLQVENDLLDAVALIQRHYGLNLVYPLAPSCFGFSRSHSRPGVLHMSLRRGRDWFVVWMGLLSFVIASAQTIYPTVKDLASRAKEHWYDHLLPHFGPQWLDALLGSTVCSFSTNMPRAGVFLDLAKYDSKQPPLEFFLRFHIPIWYCWDADMAKQQKFAPLAPLPHQLQEGTTILSKSPHPPRPTLLLPSTVAPLLASSSWPKSMAWVEFLTCRQKRYEEQVQKETPQQRQVRLARLHNPPKTTVKVFEWLTNDNGDLFREAVPKKMREDVLGGYPTCQIYYDPIENEYDCCDKYDSGAPGEACNDDDDDDDDDEGMPSWGEDDVGVVPLSGEQCRTARPPSPDVEIDDSWNSSLLAPDPRSPENFTAEVHRILFLHFGYTPVIPTPQFRDPVLKSETEMRRFVRFFGMSWNHLPLAAFGTDPISAAATFVNRLRTQGSSIPADEWDLCRENRQSIFFSLRLKTVRCVGENLFMFDFKEHSTVKWKLTATTPAHTLLICRLDPQLDETGLAYYLLENGIPFHTLQLATTLSRSPLSNQPPLVIPCRNASYVFTVQDYEAFRQQCHVIFKQARGRAALLRGYYPWRLAMNDIGFASVFSGPSGWSTNPEEMLVVRVPETAEEFIDDRLTDVELKFLSGHYNVSTNIPGQTASLSWYPPMVKFENSGRNVGRWTETEEAEFLVRERRNAAKEPNSAAEIRREPQPLHKWKNGLRGASDIHQGLLRINREARAVIEQR